LAAAKVARAPKEVLSALADFFAADRRRYQNAAKGDRYLDLSTEARTLLAAVRTGLSTDVPGRIVRVLADADRVLAERDELDRKLASAPAEDAIATLAAKRAEAQDTLAEAERVLKTLEAESDRVTREHEAKWNEYTGLMDKSVDEQHEQQAVE